jgi:phosphoserine aminotransferase
LCNAGARPLNHIANAQFYKLIDGSRGFYTNTVHPDFRSRTSVPFRIRGGDTALEELFIAEAKQVGLYQLSGHHTVGGLRVCLYNGIPDEALQALHFFMLAFQDRYEARGC